MKKTLQLLIVEDSDDDAQLLVLELQRCGYEVAYRRVQTPAAMDDALREKGWDLIVSDYAMPGFDGPRALALAQRVAPGVPFVIVSGTVGEETAVECMRAGASDFMSKDNLRRLGPAVERELSQARDRKAREEARTELEKQLLQAQKMEAVGRLAGGVAHDFNNLLTVILSFVTFAMETLTEEHPAHADLREVGKAAQRAVALTRQLLAFSRKHVDQTRPVNLNALLPDMERMLRRVLGEQVELTSTFAESLWNTKVDPGHFEQVIMNLAVNARDAMTEGGRLVLETRNATVEHERGGESRQGDFVVVTVSDTGTGMDEETRSKIFEPFYTTKPEGKGTGLGLSTCYGIVRQAGGFIEVRSKPGKGTTFEVFLPRHRGPVSQSPGALPRNVLGGSETILVAEDDDLVRAIVVRTLKRNGYQVLQATNAEEALRAAEEHGRPIHLLLTDVVMPGMNGKALADRVHHLHPETRALYISGYADDTIIQEVIAEGARLLAKPFSAESLCREVREVLEPHG